MNEKSEKYSNYYILVSIIMLIVLYLALFFRNEVLLIISEILIHILFFIGIKMLFLNFVSNKQP